MAYVPALELRRLTAALWTLGLHCSLPSKGESARDFVLLTLLKLQYVIEPPIFVSEEGDTQVSPGAHQPGDPSKGAAAAALRAAKTPKEKLKILQRVAGFMFQRVGVVLNLSALFKAEGPAVSELRRLAEALASAALRSLERQGEEADALKISRNLSECEVTDTHKQTTECQQHKSESLTKESCKAAERVQKSAAKVLASLQRFFGEALTEERKEANSFLQAVLAPRNDAAGLHGKKLLEQRLQQSRNAIEETKRSNEALESQVRELREKIRSAENDADRLSKQLLLLRRSQSSAAASEEQAQQELQEQLRELYLQYARRSAACDALMASVEDITNRAEAAAAQNRRRLQETRERMLLQETSAASATESQSNCLDTLCDGISEDMGMTLATSEQLCTEGSELDLGAI